MSVSQEDFFPNYFDAFEPPLEPTEENVNLVREFCLEKWRERAQEKDPNVHPSSIDLSSSCKFTALFGSVVFGADITGNYDHVYNVVEGKVVDINAYAADVIGKPGIQRIDNEFLREPDFIESMKTCVPRVTDWIDDFALQMFLQPNPAA